MLMTATTPNADYPDYPAALTAVEAEAVVLGALMIENNLVDRVADIVTEADFYEPLHARIYAAIVQFVSEGRRAAPPLLSPLFENDPGMVALGGGYLAKLTGSGAGLINTADYARQIAELGKARRLYDALNDARASLARRDAHAGPLEEVVDGVDAAMTAALQRTSTEKSMTGVQAWDSTIAEIEAEASGEIPKGLSVAGFDDWNAITGTMRRGEIIILGGRPSMGKTAVALSTALACARGGHGTLFVSLEMSIQELMKRAISDLIFRWGESASFENVQRGKFNAFDRERLTEAREQLKAWPITIRQDSGLKVGRLAMMIRRYKRQMAARGQTLEVVFLDYLGLVRADSKKISRVEEVSEVSRTLKQIARELDVAIVVLAQLNREVEKREDKRPVLSDLRDSGEIEQDADVVLFVYREQYYLERAEPDPHDKKRADWQVSMDAARDKVELISAKVRNGRIGKRVCHFFAAHQAVRGSDFFSSRGQR